MFALENLGKWATPTIGQHFHHADSKHQLLECVKSLPFVHTRRQVAFAKCLNPVRKLAPAETTKGSKKEHYAT